MTEKEFRDFMDKVEKDSIKKKSDENKNQSENKAFLFCGHELSSGVCCGLEMGHTCDHEYITKADIDYEQKLRSEEINPDEAYESDKIADANSEFPPIPNTDPDDNNIQAKLLEDVKVNEESVDKFKKDKKGEPEGGFIKIDPHNSLNDKPSDTNLDFRHNKTELAVAIGILVLAGGIGLFLLYDNYDVVLGYIDDFGSVMIPSIGENIFVQTPKKPKVTPGEIIEDRKIITEEGSMIVNPVERTPREFNPQQENDQTPLPLEPSARTDEFSQLLPDNAFIVYSDGDWKATYLDGGNIPKDYFGSGYKILIFDCWKDFDNVKHFFGVFQIIKGTTLQVDMNIIGAYPSFSEEIGQGRSITWEGICP